MLSGANAPQLANSLGHIKQTIATMKSLSDPQKALQNLMAQKNPGMMQALEYIKAHGNDPKAAFEALANERGIDPAEIESLMK